MYASFLIYMKYYRKFIFGNFCHLYSLNKRNDAMEKWMGMTCCFHRSLRNAQIALECSDIYFFLISSVKT